ncbi:MAG: hypothetical protein Q9167_004565 [Letrouitia subvulpina]
MTIPILDLKLSENPNQRNLLLGQLQDALFNIGFLYIKNHGVPEDIVRELVSQIPELFNLSDLSKSKLSKINSPHFLGYSGLAQETTQGKRDLREQFDFATELPIIYEEGSSKDTFIRYFSSPYWRLRGPNLWPDENELPGFRKALQNYHDALSELSYRFVHLIEEAFNIPIGTFDEFFATPSASESSSASRLESSCKNGFLCPQHRLKLIKYHVAHDDSGSQGVGPHKDSSGWLTFLHQVGSEKGLEILDRNGNWLPANPIPGTFVVNFGNAFEAATEGAIRATVHRVQAPSQRERFSIPFFMGLPLDLKVSEIKSFIPEAVRLMRRKENDKSPVEAAVSTFLDPRWDMLGDSVLRKWIRSHPDVGLKWYGFETFEYYTQ